MNWQIFSDLDGTLLDAHTYSFDAAKPALTFLRDKKIAVIPCTSKTHQEVIKLRHQMDLQDPFIVENGSAIFIPKGYFKKEPEYQTEFDNYSVIVLGKEYAEITKFLDEIKTNFNLPLSGFNEMSLKEIQNLTGLDSQDALQAKTRYFSEPFILNKTIAFPEHIKELIVNRGYRLLRGNRFYHLLGNSDKGKAVNILTQLYAQNLSHNENRTIGIGDSLNDVEMLQAVNIPVLVCKPDGTYQQGITEDNLIRTKNIGPAGWNEAVFQLLAT